MIYDCFKKMVYYSSDDNLHVVIKILELCLVPNAISDTNALFSLLQNNDEAETHRNILLLTPHIVHFVYIYNQ